jgi:hypothetical protein
MILVFEQEKDIGFWGRGTAGRDASGTRGARDGENN